MRAVQRLKGLGWLVSCVVVVLGCYMLSLSVAAERNKLARVNLQIALAERDLRALGTEFDTRANMVQLERWNGEVLALTAPTAPQFVRDEAQFAALVRSPAGVPEVKMAALVVPAGVTPIDTANAAAVAAVAATPKPTPAVARVAVVEEARPAAPVAAPARAAAPARVAAARPAVAQRRPAAATASDTALAADLAAERRAADKRARAVAMLDRKLLSDATMGDIVSGARRELSRRR